MKSPKLGEGTSVSVENITPLGIWLFVKDKEYFLSYKDYPYFKDQTIGSILNVELIHGFHLYWPDLDVDLELDNLENPEKYPLKSKTEIVKENKSKNLYKTGSIRKDILIGDLKKIPTSAEGTVRSNKKVSKIKSKHRSFLGDWR